MKEYKFLENITSSNVESEINTLSEKGWKVISVNALSKDVDGGKHKFSALLEYDHDSDSTYSNLIEAIDDLNEKVTEMDRSLKKVLKNLIEIEAVSKSSISD